MGTISGAEMPEISNVINVTSIELLCAAQAPDFHILPFLRGWAVARKKPRDVREHVLPEKDRALYLKCVNWPNWFWREIRGQGI